MNGTKRMAGPGWRVLEAPRVSHAELERLAHLAWDLAFHGIPFPAGWRVRWGELRSNWRGVTDLRAKIVLLDEGAQRGRTWRDMLTTVLHELVHVTHPTEVHGAGFEETLRRVVAYVIPADGLADTSQPAGPRLPTRTEGMAMDDGWEYAMVKHADGRPVVRTAAQASLAKFQRARAANGGRAPTGPDGQPMVWNDVLGWHSRSAPPSPGGLSLREALQKQLRVSQQIMADAQAARGETDLGRRLHARRRACLEQERAEARAREQRGEALYAQASEAALQFWRQYCKGFVGNLDPSPDERVGQELADCFPASRPTLAARHARYARTGQWAPL